MLLFGTILIVMFKESSSLLVKNIVTNFDLATIVIEFEPKFIVHPSTYLNKVLLAGDKQIELYNISSCNRVFALHNQPAIEAHLLGADITLLATSPVVDIVALGLSDGKILMINLKSAVVVRLFRQSFPATCLAFSTNIARDPM